MSTVRRLKRARRELSAYKRHELLTGTILYAVRGYDGYGDGIGTDLNDFVSAEMRNDWTEHREELLRLWATGEPAASKPWLFVCGSADTLPWAEQQFNRKLRHDDPNR